MLRRLRDPHLICCLLLFAMTLICFYPGFMTNDSFAQYQQALSGNFTDGHPPVMSFIWSLLWPSKLHQLGMLVFQLGLFWLGFALVIRRLFVRSSWRIAITLLFLFTPSLFTQLGTIWKDVIVSASLLFAVALMTQKSRKSSLWATIPLLFLGLSARHNALPAVLPLCIWWAAIQTNDQQGALCRKPKTYALGCALCLGLFACSLGLTSWLTRGKSDHPAQIVQIYDLAGISIQKNEQVMPEYLKTTLPLKRLKASYSVQDDVKLVFSNPSPLTSDSGNLRELTRFWLAHVFEDAPAYLRHREAVFKDLVSWNTPANHYSFQAGIEPNTFGFHFKGNIFYKFLYRYFFKLKNSFLFRGWIYIAACILIMGSSFSTKKRQSELFWLGLSGFLYAIAYFICSPSSEFRYLYWTVMAALVGAMIGISALLKPHPDNKINRGDG